MSRRALAAALARLSLLPFVATDARAQAADRGIGGTGLVPGAEEKPGDRGIGGTGVIGTIRAFGSIVVNGLRIAYPDGVPVMVDDRPASAADLKLGQVVRVAAEHRRRGYVARSIWVTSEVVGPVEAVASDRLVVMGQAVAVAPGSASDLKPGDRVAVAGLRQADGTILASLIEPRPDAPLRVAGPVRTAADGKLMIGDLVITGLDPALAGHRCSAVGTELDGAFVAGAVKDERDVLADLRPARLIVEAFVSRGPDGLRLGSGLAVESGPQTALPALARDMAAILTVGVTAMGRLDVRSIRADPGLSGGARRSGLGSGGDRHAAPGPRGSDSAPAGSRPGSQAAPSHGPPASGGPGTAGRGRP